MGQDRGRKTHRLEATPATVAYGYYRAEAQPAIRIRSGDIVDVDTLPTNTPAVSSAQVAPSVGVHVKVPKNIFK